MEGGGVALYVRDDFTVTILASSTTQGPGKPLLPEYLFCQVQQGNSPPILIGVIYRPPNVAMQKNSDLFQVLRDLCSEFSHKIIMGDLNGNLASKADPDAAAIKNLARELSLQIVQHGPTHHQTAATHTWIDVIMTDENDHVRDYNNECLPSFGKHAIIDATINVYMPAPIRDSFSYRDFKNISPQTLNELLACCDWTSMHEIESDLEGALENLNANLSAAIDQLAPIKEIKPSKKYAPWFGPELRELVDKRNAIHRRYKRTGHAALLREFLRLSHEVDCRITRERNSFHHNQLTEALDTNKDIWKEMRNLGLLPKNKKEDLGKFTPEELNAHFAGVSVSPLEDIEDAMDIILSASEDGFTFKPIEFHDVVLAVSHFSSQARGADGVPHRVVAKALPVIGEYLVKIFNTSFAQGIFPRAWKRAQIIALKKTPTPTTVSEFRPIALLCFLSKVLEKIAHDQITEYLNNNNILDPFQAGFRKHHSTQTALLKLTDDVRMAIDKQKVTLLLLFDFSKAFDTVSPTKLLDKLHQLGFSRSALLWIKSYLQGRSQMVSSSKKGNSEWLETNLGVPQGSVLGPLLFCIYVNNLQDILKGSSINHIFYADDLQVYVHTTKDKITEGLARLSVAARLVSEWADHSRLNLNAGKTKAIVFGSKQNVNAINALNLPGVRMPDGLDIPFSHEVVSLGVVLDSKLTWEPQVDSVTKKVNKALYTLRFIRACTTETLRRRLVESLVQPHLDYCSVIYLDASNKQLIRIQRLSNSCVRYVCGARRDEHISPYRKRLGWLRSDSRRLYFAALLMYKILRMREPSYLAAFFTPHKPRPTSRGEQPELMPPKVRTESGARSFQSRAARLWNTLPSSLRQLPSYNLFRRAVRQHLFGLDP